MSSIQNVSQRQLTIQVGSHIDDQNLSKTQTSLRSLETGDRLQGKIISMSDDGQGKSAMINIGGDEVISAKLSDGMALKEGQYVSFEVRGTTGQITLTPLFENMTASPTMLKALSAAGLEASNDNINMVKVMMENGASIDKESLTSMHSLISAHEGTDVQTLVQMKSLNIPINDQNIAQFESYKNYEHKVVETIDSIIEDLPEAYNELTQSGDVKAANDMYGKILNMLSGGYTEDSKSILNTENLNQGVLAGGEDADNTSDSLGNGLLNIDAEEINTASIDSQNAGKLQGALQELKTEDNLISDGKDAVLANDLEENPEKTLSINSKEGTASLDTKGDSVQSAVTDKDFVNLLKEIGKDAGLSGSEIDKLLSSSELPDDISPEKIIKELSESYQNSGHVSKEAEEAFQKLFSSDGYNKLIKGAIKDSWLIKPEDVRDKENVENLYQRLNTQAKQLTEALTHSLGSESKLTQNVMNLQNNIDFMNELNHMFHYIQLPLKMSEQDVHGDLYVYSNGKRKFEPGETVSAILHLDMDNLGPLDVYVKMKDNNVKTNFYVADEEVLDLIADNIDILNERLEKRGYSMQARMMLHTDMDDDSEDIPVDEMLGVDKMSLLSINSFDARA